MSIPVPRAAQQAPAGDEAFVDGAASSPRRSHIVEERIVIRVHQFAPALGLPNASPFCMKLETYLRMAGLPFELVNEIRKESETKFRKSEQALVAKLQGLQERLAKVAQKTAPDGAISLSLSEQDKQAVESARADMISTRQQLRNVKHALRADIESLEGWVKFINIALVPLLIGAGGLAFAAYRRRRVANP